MSTIRLCMHESPIYIYIYIYIKLAYSIYDYQATGTKEKDKLFPVFFLLHWSLQTVIN